MMNLLVFDSISSGTRACLYTPEGTLCAQAYSPLPILLSGCKAQQDAADWWRSLTACTRQLLQSADASQIAAVSFTAQCMCCLCVDGAGTPLHPALTWSDTRARELGPYPCQDRTAFYTVTGSPDHFGSGIQKLRWFQVRQPDIYRKTAKMLQCKDYLAYKLTGRMCTDYSDACCTCAFDLVQRQWSAEVLARLDIAASKLPDAFPSNTIIGAVTDRAAAETGLAAGTPVVIGGQDFVCSALGAGCVHPGDIYLSLGSSSWIAACSEKPVLDRGCTMSNQIYPVPGTYLSIANLQGIGTVFKWLRNKILRYAEPDTNDVEPYRNLYPYTGLGQRIAQSRPGSNGLLFMPYLLEGAPNCPSWSSAAYIGLNWRHSQEDLLRAALEGVVFDLRTYLDLICSTARQAPPSITVVGSAAHESEWLQLIADILGLPVKNTTLSGTPDSIGAAIIAGNAIGVYDGFDEAHRFWSFQHTFYPDPARHSFYNRLYSVFLQSRQQLLPIQKELHTLQAVPS